MTVTRRFVLTAAAAATVIPTLAAAETNPVYSSRGVAVDGSDVVGYFTQGRPVKGSREFTHMWNGAEWRFTSAKNRDLFAQNPEAYAPQYGGYCAYAVSEGYTASTTPEAWKIVDGKLYLNYSNRVKRRWEKDIPGRIARADANWPSVLN